MGIELLRHRLKGTTVEFYDCAGQVDYAGMHQTFLSRRALYLLVWDVRRCDGKDGDALDKVGGPWQEVGFVVVATRPCFKMRLSTYRFSLRVGTQHSAREFCSFYLGWPW